MNGTTEIVSETIRYGDVISSDREILGGVPVFKGTRVPVKSLFDHIEGGDSLDVFLDNFPGVSREQAVTVLELARVKLTEEFARV